MKITNAMFSGLGKLFDGTLAAALQRVLQVMALDKLTAVTDLTDSSGGASGGNALPDITAFTGADVGGTTGASKTDFDARVAVIRNNVATFAAQINALNAVAPADAVTDNSAGTPALPTIAAIAATGAGVAAGSAVEINSGNAILQEIRDEVSELVVMVNKYAKATGKTAISFPAGWFGNPAYDGIISAMSAATGAAGTGSNSDSVLKTDADARLVEIANVCATLAAKLNEVTGGGTTVSVVAA